MKRTLLFLFSMFAVAGLVSAQSQANTLLVRPSLGGVVTPNGQGADGRAAQAAVQSAGTQTLTDPTVKDSAMKDLAVDTSTTKAAAKPSSAEALFAKLLVDGSKLEQYGYGVTQPAKVFQGANVSPNYVLGPGDQLTILLWGDPVDLGELLPVVQTEVNRSGGLFFAPVGLVPASGLALADVERTLTAGLAKKYKRFDLRLTVSQLRQYPVLVTGFVNSPGMVPVTAGQGILGVLQAAGGVSKNGSLRSIQLRTREGQVRSIDLYELLLKGHPLEMELREGDSLFVPALGPVVGVAGAVQRPAIYEGLAGESLADLIAMAGGPSAASQPDGVRLSAVKNGQVEVVQGALGDAGFLARPLASGQLLELFSGSLGVRNGVWVEGAVSNPGWFSLERASSLSTLLPLLGLRADTDLGQGQLVRTDALTGEVRVLGLVPRDILQKKTDLSLQPFDKVRLFPNQSDQAVVVAGAVERGVSVPWRDGLDLLDVLGQVTLKGDPRDLVAQISTSSGVRKDVFLRDLLTTRSAAKNPMTAGSQVEIVALPPETVQEVVTVTGAVVHPGVYPLQQGMTISTLIELAGGLTDKAFLEGLFMTRVSVVEGQTVLNSKILGSLNQEIATLQTQVLAATDPLVKANAEAQLSAKQSELQVLRADMVTSMGRISVVAPDSLSALKKTSQNLPLEAKDTVYIPSTPNFVVVLGAVYNQSTQAYAPGVTVADALASSGGITEAGNPDKVYVVRANGMVESSSRHQLFLWNTFGQMRLGPGDAVVVPTKDVNTVDAWAVFKDSLNVLGTTVGITANSMAIMKTLGVLK